MFEVCGCVFVSIVKGVAGSRRKLLSVCFMRGPAGRVAAGSCVDGCGL